MSSRDRTSDPSASRSDGGTGLKRLDVGRLLAFRALLHFKTDLLILLQRLKAVSLHFRKMRKQILTAVIRRDEAKALCVVEPLYGYRLPSADFPGSRAFRVLTPPIALESGIDFVARENRSGQPGSALMLRRLTIYSVAVGNSCTSTIASAEQVAGASAAPFTDEASWRLSLLNHFRYAIAHNEKVR